MVGVMDDVMSDEGENWYKQIHKHTFKNLDEVRASKHALCLYCKRMIDVEAMFRDVDLEDICPACTNDDEMEETVFCPHCGIDAVIGDASGLPVTSSDFVEKLNSWAFRNAPQ